MASTWSQRACWCVLICFPLCVGSLGTDIDLTQPYTALTNFPWHGALEYRLETLKLRHMNAFIALTRDRDAGYVYPDPVSGKPRISYTPSAFDSAHAATGAAALCQILYVTGATEIHPFVPGIEPYIRPSPPIPDNSNDDGNHYGPPSSADNDLPAGAGPWSYRPSDPRPDSADSQVAIVVEPPPQQPASTPYSPEADDTFASWLTRLKAATESGKMLSSPVTPWSSAHQMSTCRMSATPDQGVVDSRGQVWGVDGLFVADSSVLPSASGVNPMVTTMAFADLIARNVGEELLALEAAGNGGGPGPPGPGQRQR